MSKQIIDKFGPILETMQKNLVDNQKVLSVISNGVLDIQKTQTPAINNIVEAIETQTPATPAINNIVEAIETQTPIFKDILGVLGDQLSLNKEQYERTVRQNRLSDVKLTDQRGSDYLNDQNINDGSSNSDFNIFGAFINPFNNLLASFTAFGLAIAGFRGWETTALSKIRSGLSSLSSVVLDGVKGLRNTILVRYFGFTPDGAIGRNARGQFTRLPPISEQIATRVSDLRARALRVFGLGVDGKPIQVRGPDGRFAGTSIIGKITSRISSLLKPLRNVSEGIGKFMTGAGKALVQSSIFQTAGAFTSAVGKILKPIGILFSVFEGVDAFMKTEGSLYDKTQAGISEALGDFFGAPLDLIKDLGAWVLKKFGFDETADAVTSFNIEQKLTDLISGIFEVPKKAVQWIKTLFTDPTEALISLWEGYVGVWSGIGQWVFDNALSPAWDWIKNKLSWSSKDDVEENEGNFISNIFNNTIDELKTFFKDLFDFIPSLDEIKGTLTSMLPSWMQPESIEKQRQNLENEIQALESQREEAPARDDISRLQDIYTTTQEEIDAEINDLVNRLNSLPQARSGGILNMPEEGGLAMLHGQEAVIPLDSNEGQSILAQKTIQLAQESAAISTSPRPVVVRGGDSLAAPVTNNNSQTTIVNNTVDPSRSLNHIPT